MRKTNVKKYILKQEKTKFKEFETIKGITLIALIVTIIVLLILAGVTIATLTGDNGILTRASDAKIETVVATVKENLHLEQIEKAMDEEEVTPETMLAEGKVKRTVQQAEDENYYMYYALKEDAVEGMQGLGKGNVASLRDVFLIDDDLNVKYIAKNGKEYGDELEEKILRDETKIRFASKAFSEYVSKISGATEEEMKFEWMKNQTSLTIDDPNVDSLEDLVFFPNLESLTLRNLTLDNLEGIENCKKLIKFSVSDMQIEDYSILSRLNNIEEIGIFGNNSLTNTNFENFIDNIKSFSKLNKLTLYSAKLDDISLLKELENIESLNYLNLAFNTIKNLEPLKNLTNLESLDLRNNMIIDISPLSSLIKLKTLYLSNNHIIDITPLASNKNLMYLYLKGNSEIDGNRNNYEEQELKELDEIGKILDRNGRIYLDIEQLGLFHNYKNLDLGNSNLSTLDILDGMAQIEDVNLNGNKLTLEDEKSQEILSSMKNLKYLYLQNNQLTDISAINNLKNLRVLFLNGNENINLAQIEDIIPNLNLRLDTKVLNTIVNCTKGKITKLSLSGSELTEIPDLSEFTNLILLKLDQNSGISNFENVSKITSLQNLDLSNNELRGRMIDFSKLTNLTNLNLSNNTLWSEDLENLKVLRNNTNLTINLSNNSIIDATALLELNPNTKINLSGNINLSQDSKDKLKARFGNNVTF